MEPDIVEIYVDKNQQLYIYVPAAAMTFLLECGEEVDFPEEPILVAQINFDLLKCEKCFKLAREHGLENVKVCDKCEHYYVGEKCQCDH